MNAQDKQYLDKIEREINRRLTGNHKLFWQLTDILSLVGVHPTTDWEMSVSSFNQIFND